MRIRIFPRLVNRKDQDPGLFIHLEGARDALLVDCGTLDGIPKIDLLRISHVFVTHTHIDHFCGFDRLLRLILGEVATVTVFGPIGITANVMGKLAGYTWNLIDEEGPIFTVKELAGDRMTVTRLRCRKGFRPEGTPTEEPVTGGLIVSDGRVKIRHAVLEHQIPSLAFSIQEEPYASIRPDRIRSLGLKEGPWLKRLQDRVLAGSIGDEPFDADGATRPLAELVDQIVQLKPGRKVTYVSDTIFNDSVCETVAELARDSDDFFCEANYQDEDLDKARAYFHLTARQAGLLAARSHVKRLILYHISRKYHGDIRTSIQQAAEEFGRVE
ncbi:MAG: hypothetical protein HY815_15315 [Candidatus Riflebacteria bacterium]|nr:hypothetical protein [Candidatus Riflebacteria bacterium]